MSVVERHTPGGTDRVPPRKRRSVSDPEGLTMLRAFPPRAVPSSWPATTLSRRELMDRLLAPPFAAGNPHTQERRGHGLSIVVDWLSAQEGKTWQERWASSCAEAEPATAWRRLAIRWKQDSGKATCRVETDFAPIGRGLAALVCGDVIRPGLPWLAAKQTMNNLAGDMASMRDPDGFTTLTSTAGGDPTNLATKGTALRRVAMILAAKGGGVADVTVGDCLELLEHVHAAAGDTNAYFYQLLHAAGLLPDNAPLTARAWSTAGQQDIETLIDRYGLACRGVRDLLVDYLAERRASLDYNTLNMLAFGLGKLFWADLECHHPGIDSLHLEPEVAAAWKRRIATKPRRAVGDDPVLPARRVDGGLAYLGMVRSFYLDLAEWAAEDPARWGPWVAPCPIRSDEVSHKKDRRRVKSRMDQRTRERLPMLQALCDTVDRRRREAAERLDVAQRTSPGQTFSVAGEILTRSVLSRWSACAVRIWAEESNSGVRRDLTKEEHRAFWAWAAVEVLRHTGIRIEELTELSHHSLVSYQLPKSGELVALLQITPSKSDAERLLVISPELADVLATIVARVRDASGAVPLVVSYDIHERVWNPPIPLLFQRPRGMEHQPISTGAIRALVTSALAGTGLTDASGRPLRFIPHDFRRIWVTEALASGLPPHIAQVICGHQDINTTISYNTVYPEEVITSHRAFLARRRASRPSEEYRVPTHEEWEEFLGYFARRQVAYGTCARAFLTPCIHEHSCLRCPMLWPDPSQRSRLVDTIENLHVRISEAHREGWLGEVSGLEVSLTGAEGKLAEIDKLSAATRVEIAMPKVRAVVAPRSKAPKQVP